MKKQTNISALKELVNNNVIERVELRTRGAQAFNIAEGEEYNVIVAFAKQGGRYYFIDRDGRRFLASHYDRAEWLAGELLEVIANDRAAAVHAADQLERSGSVLVCADLLALFFEECDLRGIKATSTAAGVDNLGRMLTKYDLVKDEPTQQDDDNNNDAQNNESNDGNQATAEPSRIAKAAAKVKAYARRAAFDMSLFAVVVLCFVFFFACIPSLNMMLQAAGFEGTACTVLTFFALLPAMDVTLWLECNALAVLARLFPGSFVGSSRPDFLRPCSIFAKMYRNL